jgi:NTE family protein
VSVYAGMNIGLLGQIRLGWLERDRRFELDTGIRLPCPISRRVSVACGRRWISTSLIACISRPEAGLPVSSILTHGKRVIRVSMPRRWRQSRLVIRYSMAGLAYTGSPNGRLPGYDAGSLGGFRNMSAYAKGQIIGDDISYVSAISARSKLSVGCRSDCVATCAWV